MSNMRLLAGLALLPLVLSDGSWAVEGEDRAAARAEQLFVHRVLPTFRTKCFACHGEDPEEIRGELDLRTREGLLRGGESESPAVVPGMPERSPLLAAVRWDSLEMPPKENDRLSDEQIEDIRQWIAGGAPWPDPQRQQELLRTAGDEWSRDDGVRVATSGGLTEQWTRRRYDPDDLWSWQPLQRVTPPREHAGESGNPIDAFISRRLDEAGLEPVGVASRRALLRRLSYDLTGLPPTPAEMEAFLSDDSPEYWSRAVERLLASRHYGEHWARHWLDVVRYADSAGYSNDFSRPNAWRYRDYVIRSLNQDKPYDQFVREQLAGDEIAPDDPDSVIAVGFLRMGPWEHTAMSVAAVTRQQFLDDVTNLVGVAFLGHELRCASCHDHKFDPIPTRDYYRIQAAFAPVQFADVPLDYQPYENTTGFEQGRARIERLIKAGGVKSLTTLPAEERPVDQWDSDSEAKGHAKVNRKRSGILERELKRFEPLAFSVYNGPPRNFVSNKPVLPPPPPAQRKGKAPSVHILTGGSIESPGEEVRPGVLSAVRLGSADGDGDSGLSLPEGLAGRREALADWLCDPRHPLTARVIANRVWQHHFGRGLAGNPNNFGATGMKPSHPELLDFLAGYLIDHDWSLKELHRLILTSDTWRRASGPVGEQMLEEDPDNQLYARFSPRRLSAEELRDSMLLASGELNRQYGGIPSRPEINMEIAMQPRHVMGSVAPAYQPSPTREDRHRRTIYAERVRTLRDPFLEVFNQPGLDTSCEARDVSTITPQAFTLLNSQRSFDRGLALAHDLRQAGGEVDAQIRGAFRRTLSREPTAEELARCREHWRQLLELQRAHVPVKVEPPRHVVREMVEEMTGLAFYWVEDLDVYADWQPDLKPWDVDAETRALADICRVLFNSNEFAYVY